jgi:hypothetical protein
VRRASGVGCNPLPLRAGLSHMKAHLLLPPPCGVRGERSSLSRSASESEPGWGFSRDLHQGGIFSVTSAPPPDRSFATATLPTLSRGRDKKDASPYAIALRCGRGCLRCLASKAGEGFAVTSEFKRCPSPEMDLRPPAEMPSPARGEGASIGIARFGVCKQNALLRLTNNNKHRIGWPCAVQSCRQ